MKRLKDKLVNSKALKTTFLIASTFSANAAMALDDTAVEAAQSAAETSVNLAVVGLIAIVAVITGVSAVIMLLKKI